MAPTNTLNQLNPLEGVSQDRWARAIGAVMAGLPIVAIHAMAAGGYKQFRAVATPVLEGHGLDEAGYRRIYAMLKRTSELNRKIDPRHMLDVHQ